MNEVLRQEKKFLISLDQYYKLSHEFANIMHMDEHAGIDGYEIRSLYFDSIDNRDFQEKEDGVELRRKLRLRNYGSNSTFAMLEMKQKQGAYQKKRSLRMSREDAIRLIKGDYEVLLGYEEDFAAECYSMIKQYCYMPRAVITYQRKPFVAKENKIRVTFDHHIMGTESNFDIFDEHLNQNYILDPYMVILEVKYNGFLLSYIKDMLKSVDKSETSVSKYCLGRAVSMHYNF